VQDVHDHFYYGLNHGGLRFPPLAELKHVCPSTNFYKRRQRMAEFVRGLMREKGCGLGQACLVVENMRPKRAASKSGKLQSVVGEWNDKMLPTVKYSRGMRP
jgi:hypothetical protein